MVFIEAPDFTARVMAFLSDEDYTALQKSLMRHPNLGKVMSGCGGIRKVRVRDPRRRKGKRGGIRILYLHVPEANWIYFVDIYDSEQDDVTPDEKKIFAALARQWKKEALDKKKEME